MLRPAPLAEELARVVAALGRPGFLGAFTGACDALFAADQVTAFAVAPEGVRCLVAHRPRGQRLVEALCRDYAAAWHRRDPLLRAAGSATPSPGLSMQAVAAAAIPDADYRARLFATVGLGGKIAVVLQGPAGAPRRVLTWNLYFRSRAGNAMARAAARLAEAGPVLAAALERHDALTGAGEGQLGGRLRELCPGLSPRELEVAVRIAAGQGVAEIAAALGLGPQTVITFRRRAYAKLGVASRAGLFARCLGLMPG
ncbi:helix-turn-helix transcriptional regulator [Roseicella sp. DB1501]|uniref:helix-turn-helix transcriptional regulator n=1 Tax=Roseicella sp. DB1501 TaxID=2730925 RepID=UPI00149146C6|nr:helix-turn-helix transcriptional regulator [Roseicella sp. DB1501]NOG71750.1 helix-turn-helix transcriptional regulator [Roseicella sp. DB1501]